MSLAVILILVVVMVSTATWWLIRVSRRYHTTDWGKPWLNFLDGLNRWFCETYHRLDYQPLELPASGCGIVAANHVSGLDPLLLCAASPRPLRFMIAREEYERFGLKWLFRAAGCIPVDRETRPERALREALRALASGDVVALFPHGGIHLDTDPPRRLKSGVIRLSHISDCEIHPVRIQGVAGEGKVISAVLLRGNPHLRNAPTLTCSGDSDHALLEKLTAILEGRDLGPETVASLTPDSNSQKLNQAG